MTTLDCVEEGVGGSIGSVGKAIGDPLGKCWKIVGIYPLNGKAFMFSCERSHIISINQYTVFMLSKESPADTTFDCHIHGAFFNCIL